MIRPSCSYWIDVKGPGAARADAKAAMAAHGIVPDLVNYVGTDKDVDSYEVPQGSTDKFDALDEAMLAVAAECPGAEIIVREVCEEPWTPERELDYAAGVLVREVIHVEKKTVRPAGAPEYDADTVGACVGFLQKHGFTDAADALRRGMPN